MGCATGMVKYLVFIFNLAFFLVGGALLGIGIFYILNFNDSLASLESEAGPFKAAPILVITIGAIILVISFFGCCGAIKESSCMLTTYACILLAILILQIALGVYALLQIKDKDGLKKTVREEISKSFDRYVKPDAGYTDKEPFDLMQQTLKCCGKTSRSDWFGHTTVGTLPRSCCSGNPATCYLSDGFDDGCTEEVYEFLDYSINVIGIVLLSLSVVELVAAVFALCLSSSIRNEGRRNHY